MQLGGGNGGVDTRPPEADQPVYYPLDPAPQAGGLERGRPPGTLWLLLGVAAVLGIILVVAVMALTSSGDTTAGAGGGDDEVGLGNAPASPATETELAGAEKILPDAADTGEVVDQADTPAGDQPDTPAGEQPDTLAVTAAPDGASATPSVPIETSTTVVETTVTTSASVTEAPTTQPPATEAPTTQPATTTTTAAPSTTVTTVAPATVSSTTATTQSPATEAPTTQPPATEAPTTQPPTTQPPATQPPAEPAGNDAAAQQQVLDLTNAERAKAGCSALRLDQTLNGVADGHSEDMAARDYFSHSDPEGNGPGVRIDASGYAGRGWGENIAAGYGSATAVVQGWMNSDGHRRNILNCNFNELGVGYAQGGSYGVYWTQVFGTR